MKKNESQENNGTENNAFTTAEKAQYQIFQKGDLPKEQLEQWIRNDLRAIQSFVHGCLNDPEIFEAVSNAYYKRYKALHNVTPIENDKP